MKMNIKLLLLLIFLAAAAAQNTRQHHSFEVSYLPVYLFGGSSHFYPTKLQDRNRGVKHRTNVQTCVGVCKLQLLASISSYFNKFAA